MIKYMTTFLLIITCLCVGYIAGSMVERVIGPKAKLLKRTNNLVDNPEACGDDDHMTGDLEKSGLTETRK